MKQIKIALVLGLLLGGLSSCDVIKKMMGKSDVINWNKQGMEPALLEAKQSKKPLFVYWGAVWCPPCNVLKAKIFPDPKFKEAIEPFVPVYLDGDTESAQLWGEKLQASGYPTLMILNSEGKEIVRLSTSVSASEMAEVMKDAYQMVQPMADVLAMAVGGEKLSKEQWRLLARYSWDQDPNLDANKEKWGKDLWRLRNKVPAELKIEGIRLGLWSLIISLSSETPKVISPELIEKKSWLEAQYKDPSVIFEVPSELAILGSSSLKSFFAEADKAGKQGWTKMVKATMGQLREGSRLPFDMRLTILLPYISMSEKVKDLEIKAVSEEERALIKAECELAIKKIESQEQRIAVVSDVSYFLAEIGEFDRAIELLKIDLENNVNPYYVMSGLASVEKKRGNKTAALEWYKKAYETADGRATKTQWGGKYISTLIEIEPENREKIFNELNLFLSNQLMLTDAFMGRNRKVIEKLMKATAAWSEKNNSKPMLQELNKRQLELHCSGAPKEGYSDSYLEACRQQFKI